MVKDGNFYLSTPLNIATLLADIILIDGEIKLDSCMKWKNVDFTVFDDNIDNISHNYTLGDAFRDSKNGFYGIHMIDIGFDDEGICLVSDYYGGNDLPTFVYLYNEMNRNDCINHIFELFYEQLEPYFDDENLMIVCRIEN